MIWNHSHLPYTISDDPGQLQHDAVYALLQTTYWAGKRTKDTMMQSIAASFCFGLYHDSEQVGFLRVVSDYATFSWVCDVIVHPEHRGNGLGKWLVEVMSGHPKLCHTNMLLGTRDAHGLYEQFGFQRMEMMRRMAPL